MPLDGLGNLPERLGSGSECVSRGSQSLRHLTRRCPSQGTIPAVSERRWARRAVLATIGLAIGASMIAPRLQNRREAAFLQVEVNASRGIAGSPQYPQTDLGREPGADPSSGSGVAFGPPATIPGKRNGVAFRLASH